MGDLSGISGKVSWTQSPRLSPHPSHLCVPTKGPHFPLLLSAPHSLAQEVRGFPPHGRWFGICRWAGRPSPPALNEPEGQHGAVHHL